MNEAKIVTTYDIIKNSIQIPYAKRKSIKAGCSLEQDNMNPEVMNVYISLDKAKDALQKYNTSIGKYSGSGGSFYEVTEYYIQENVYAEDGEWIDGGDVWELTKPQISIVSKETYNTLCTFDNYEEAERYINDIDEEVYISFDTNDAKKLTPTYELT